jgi:NCAIR mutase (PurE)-related protein
MSKRFNIDYSRKERLGFDEVIFGASKSANLLIELLNEYTEKKQNVLITKL